MKTPFSIYLVGIIQCLGSLIFMLLAAATLFASATKPATEGPMPHIALISVAIFGALGSLGLATGICLCMRMNWARWSTLIFSWFCIVECGIGAVIFAFMPIPAMVDQHIVSVVRGIMSGGSLLLVLLFGWWAWLLTRPRIKAVFLGDAPPATPSRRPLSISIIGWWWLVAGVSCLFTLALPFSAVPLGGWVLTGWSAKLVMLPWCAAYIAIGWGLLKLAEWARRLGIVAIGLLTLNSLLFGFLPGRAARIDAIMQAAAAWQPTQPQPVFAFSASFYSACMAGGIILMLVPLYFLIARKSAFVPLPPESPGPTPPPPPPPSLEA